MLLRVAAECMCQGELSPDRLPKIDKQPARKNAGEAHVEVKIRHHPSIPLLTEVPNRNGDDAEEDNGVVYNIVLSKHTFQ